MKRILSGGFVAGFDRVVRGEPRGCGQEIKAENEKLKRNAALGGQRQGEERDPDVEENFRRLPRRFTISTLTAEIEPKKEPRV
jgi:hypothetical protein